MKFISKLLNKARYSALVALGSLALQSSSAVFGMQGSNVSSSAAPNSNKNITDLSYLALNGNGQVKEDFLACYVPLHKLQGLEIKDCGAKLDLQTLFIKVMLLCQNLRQFNLVNNCLTALPVVIGNFENLQSLNLENNLLKTLPDSIGQLKNLQALNFSNNPLTNLPSTIGKLTKLKYLLLIDCKLIVLPQAIGQLTNLEILNLTRNQLIALPAAIGQLTNLNILKLSGNQLTELPATINKLMSAQIYLYGNQFADDEVTQQMFAGLIARGIRVYVYN